MKFDDNESWRYSRWEGGSAGGCHATPLPQARVAPLPPLIHNLSSRHPPSAVHRLRLHRTVNQPLQPNSVRLSSFFWLTFLVSSFSLPAFPSLPRPPSTAHWLVTLSIRVAGRAADGEAAWSSVARAPGVPLDCQSRTRRREGSAPCSLSWRQALSRSLTPLHAANTLVSLSPSALDNALLSISHKYVCFMFFAWTYTCCSSYHLITAKMRDS